jgi:hypothetical protein
MGFQLTGEDLPPIKFSEHFNRLGRRIAQLQDALGIGDIAYVADFHELEGLPCTVVIRRNEKGSARFKLLEVLPPDPPAEQSNNNSNEAEPVSQDKEEQGDE